MNAGAAAETLAAEFLEARGLAVVKRNYRCRGDEIDRIVRRSAPAQQQRLRQSACQHHRRQAPPHQVRRRPFLSNLRREPPCRFDAILLDGLDMARIEWRVDIDIG